MTAPKLTSQLVVLSEIEFQGQWIEIVNLGQKEADLGEWSLYLATQTPNTPQNYWWGFPRGTKLQPGAFVRVHWLAKIQQSTATDIYTGDTLFHFLFGLFAESLDPNRGALALFSTQANNQMNDRSKIMDWVSWGTTGFKRENLAVDNGRWKAGTTAPAATGTPLPSIAYDYSAPAGVHEGSDWFRDSTPSPGKDNVGGASAALYGTACTFGTAQLAQQVLNSKPYHGNLDFYLGIGRDLSAQEFPLILFGARGDGSFKFFDCPYWLSLQLSPIVVPVAKQGTTARFSFTGIDPDFIAGLQIASIWIVFEADAQLQKITGLAFTQGAEFKFGTK